MPGNSTRKLSLSADGQRPRVFSDSLQQADLDGHSRDTAQAVGA